MLPKKINQYNKKYFIKTWGCQMNVYDSIRIGEILQSVGYEKTTKLSESDLIILNTCHIREKATEKVYSEIGRLREFKTRRAVVGKNLIIAVSGCVAQAEGEEIMKRVPYVDLVFGPQTWHRLPFMIEVVEKNIKVCNTDFPPEEKFDFLPSFFDKDKVSGGSSFLAIQEGCDKFCTYCVVPYTRGSEYSRPISKVMVEAASLVAHGAKEIILLGQNVSSYHGVDNKGKERTLGYLIAQLAKLDNLKRIRYITSHPKEIDEELIEVHRDIDKLMPFLHLPIQSGSDNILKKMNRKHTAQEYIEVINKLKKVKPNLAISSDFIVGFPNESDEDFKATLDIVKEVGFVQSYSFIYSKRPGTPAAVYEDSVSKEVKENRLYELQGLLNNHQETFNKTFVNKSIPVLLNQFKESGNINGKTEYMQQVQLQGSASEFFGDVVEVDITDSNVNVLKGVVATNSVLRNSNIKAV